MSEERVSAHMSAHVHGATWELSVRASDQWLLSARDGRLGFCPELDIHMDADAFRDLARLLKPHMPSDIDEPAVT